MSSTTFVQQLTQKFEQFLQKEDNIFTKTLAKIESSTNISRLYLANSLIIIFVSYMIFGYFAQLICNTIGFIYPAYASLVALDLPQTEENLQIKQLLRYWLKKINKTKLLTNKLNIFLKISYWVVYAFMSVGDFFSGSLFRIIPFYWLTKMCFLIWCIAPIENNGSNVLYFKFIRPVFVQIQPIISGYFATIMSHFNGEHED